MKRTAYIGLGANQGEMVESLKAAFDSLRSLEQSELQAVSPFYKSAPIDAPGPDFVNAGTQHPGPGGRTYQQS